jgi:hypothetical protein
MFFYNLLILLCNLRKNGGRIAAGQAAGSRVPGRPADRRRPRPGRRDLAGLALCRNGVFRGFLLPAVLPPDLLPNHSRQPETSPDTRSGSPEKCHPFDRFNSTIRDVIRPIATLTVVPGITMASHDRRRARRVGEYKSGVTTHHVILNPDGQLVLKPGDEPRPFYGLCHPPAQSGHRRHSPEGMAIVAAA